MESLAKFRYALKLSNTTFFERNLYFMNYCGGNCRKLFIFALLNGDIPDIETIYFVSIEQKKENCLQKLPDVAVITKHEVICSANK